VFALIALGITGCTIVSVLHETRENAKRDALWTQGMTLLNRSDGYRVWARVGSLFPDVDGVCVALNAAGFDERVMRAFSPAKVAAAFADVTRHAEQDRPAGWNGDTKIWLLYAVRGGRVVNSYQLLMKSDFDVESGDRCYGEGEFLELNYHPPKLHGGTGSMTINFAPDHG
jgi:hypothetical protein